MTLLSVTVEGHPFIVSHSFLKIQLLFKMLVKIFSPVQAGAMPVPASGSPDVECGLGSSLSGRYSGSRGFQGAADSPVALLGRGFCSQCSIFISRDEADTLAS